MIWFGWILWHINHFRFSELNTVYTYILNIYYLVWSYGISTITKSSFIYIYIYMCVCVLIV